MKRLLSALCLLLFAAAALAQNPVAQPSSQVVVGNARFTVLTDRLVRMEWSEQGQFEDHATLAIVNRELPVPAFSVSRTGDWLLIKT